VTELRVRFGCNLKFLRTKQNLTQQLLAEKTGLSVDFIGMIERGERAPSFETLEILANALKVTVADLFFEDGQNNIGGKK
jgi:transcriptional regulator with XRE-family HTH domain